MFLAPQRELVIQIEEVLNQCNYIVFDEADKMVDIGFEDYVNRTFLAIPNTNVKVSSEDSTAFRKLNIDHNDDEDKVHWTEKTLAQLSTRDWSIWQEDFQIFIPGGQLLNPMQVLAEGPLLWELLEAVHTAGYAKPTRSRCRPT